MHVPVCKFTEVIVTISHDWYMHCYVMLWFSRRRT